MLFKLEHGERIVRESRIVIIQGGLVSSEELH